VFRIEVLVGADCSMLVLRLQGGLLHSRQSLQLFAVTCLLAKTYVANMYAIAPVFYRTILLALLIPSNHHSI
jgi:hypothetical protein